MADGVNIFDLAAKISVDASQSDKALTETQKKVLELAKKFQSTEQTVVASSKKMGQAVTQTAGSFTKLETATIKSSNALRSDLGGALNVVSPRLAALSSAGGPVTALATAFLINIGAVTALGAALFNLTKNAADFGSKIHDTAQETGTTAEVISTFAYAAKLSGKTLEDITPALKRFEITIGDAAKGSKEAEAALKRLGVDPKKAITDLDGALAKAIKTIHEAGGGIAQVNLAADAFGKRSGPKMISTIETMDGDFAAFQKRAKELGVVLSTDSANAADAFGDKLDELSERVRFLGIQFGLELVPQVTAAMDIIERSIQNTPKVAAVATAIIKSLIEQEVLAPLRIIESVLKAIEKPHTIPLKIALSGPAALIAYFLGSGVGPTQNVGADVGGDVFRKGAARPMPSYGGGGGGGGGGGRGGALREDPGVRLLKQLQEELDRLTPKTKAQEIAEKLLNKEFDKTTDAVKKRIQIAAMDIDAQKMVLGIERERIVTLERLAEAHEKEMMKALERSRRVFAMERERMATREGQNRPPWIDLGGGSTVGGEPATTTRGRVVTVDEQVARERLQIFNERMRAAAANVTAVLDRALYEGLTGGGVKGGLAALGEGLLDIVQRFFLARLEEGLLKIFSDLGKKGGIWGTIFGVLAGAATGGIGGIGGGGGSGSAGGLGGAAGGVFAGGFASGGTIPMGQWGIVHEGEKVKATSRGAEVIPSRSGDGGRPVIVNQNFYLNDVRDLNRPETRTQMRNRIARDLRTV